MTVTHDGKCPLCGERIAATRGDRLGDLQDHLGHDCRETEKQAARKQD